MSNDFGELILVQSVYVVILLLILWLKRKRKRERIAYWGISAVYASVVGWLIYEYFTFGSHPDPGSVFACGMTSIMFPGLMVSSAIVTAVISSMIKRRNT